MRASVTVAVATTVKAHSAIRCQAVMRELIGSSKLLTAILSHAAVTTARVRRHIKKTDGNPQN